jgi:hypothetical protein
MIEEKDEELEFSVPAEQHSAIPAPLQEGASLVTPEDTFFCWNCGARNARGANYCCNCGEDLSQESVAGKRPPIKTFQLFAMIEVLVGVIVIGVIWIATRQNASVPKAVTTAEVKKTPVATADTTQKPVIPVAKPEPKADTLKKESSPTPGSIAKKLAGTGPLTAEKKQAKIEEVLKDAQLYLNLRSFDEATNKYMQVLKLDPQNDDALDGLRMVRDAKDKAAADSAKK